MNKEKIISEFQVVFTYDYINIGDKLEFAQTLKQELGDLVSGDSIVLPDNIRGNIPGLPLFVLQSKDNKTQLNVGSDYNINIVYLPPENKKLDLHELSLKLTSVKTLLSSLKKITNKYPIKMGCVIHFDLKKEQGVAASLKTKFFKKSTILNDTIDLELSLFRIQNINNTDSNVWLRFLSNKVRNIPDDTIKYLYDFNTYINPVINVDDEFSEKYINDCINFINNEYPLL